MYVCMYVCMYMYVHVCMYICHTLVSVGSLVACAHKHDVHEVVLMLTNASAVSMDLSSLEHENRSKGDCVTREGKGTI